MAKLIPRHLSDPDQEYLEECVQFEASMPRGCERGKTVVESVLVFITKGVWH